MPLAIEEAFWRIAQEALSNVARHSQASKVQMCLKYAPEQVTLSIADNGRGFDLAGVQQTGIGLHSMRERMTGVGGTVTIQSRPARGPACWPAASRSDIMAQKSSSRFPLLEIRLFSVGGWNVVVCAII